MERNIKEKRKIVINGCDTGSVRIGEKALVIINGKLAKTSTVVSAMVSSKRVYIETKNSIYTTV